MTNEKAREARRNFYVGERKEHGTFSIASAEASPLHGKFYPSRRNADGVSWNHLSAEKRKQFSKAIETEGQGVLVFTAVTIIDSTQVDVIREKQRDRVISSRHVLRWKETDTGYKPKTRSLFSFLFPLFSFLFFFSFVRSFVLSFFHPESGLKIIFLQ